MEKQYPSVRSVETKRRHAPDMSQAPSQSFFQLGREVSYPVLPFSSVINFSNHLLLIEHKTAANMKSSII